MPPGELLTQTAAVFDRSRAWKKSLRGRYLRKLGGRVARLIVTRVTGVRRGAVSLNPHAVSSCNDSRHSRSQGFVLMSWNNLFRLACVGFFLGGVFVAGAFSQAPSQAELRANSRKLMNDGNFNDAYQGFRKLCLDPKSDPRRGHSGSVSCGPVPLQPRPCERVRRAGRKHDRRSQGKLAAALQTAAQQYIEHPAPGVHDRRQVMSAARTAAAAK